MTYKNHDQMLSVDAQGTVNFLGRRAYALTITPYRLKIRISHLENVIAASVSQYYCLEQRNPNYDNNHLNSEIELCKLKKCLPPNLSVS